MKGNTYRAPANPCAECGGMFRYTRSGACVVCIRRRRGWALAESNSSRAGMREATEPCKVCGGTQRYVKYGHCVTCQRAKNKEIWLARKAQGPNIRPPRTREEMDAVMERVNYEAAYEGATW